MKKSKEFVNAKSAFERPQEPVYSLNSDVCDQKTVYKEQAAEMEAYRQRPTDKNKLVIELGREIAELQSNNTKLTNRVLNLTGELLKLQIGNEDIETHLRGICISFVHEQKLAENQMKSYQISSAERDVPIKAAAAAVDQDRGKIAIIKDVRGLRTTELNRQ